MAYKYGMRLRGFGPGCQPKEGLLYGEDDITGKYWDIIVYDRPLTDKEIAEYELDYLPDVVENTCNKYEKRVECVQGGKDMTNEEKTLNINRIVELSGEKRNRKKFADRYGIPYRTVADWCLGNSFPAEYIMDALECAVRAELGMPYLYRIIDTSDNERVVFRTAMRTIAMKKLEEIQRPDKRYKLIESNG